LKTTAALFRAVANETRLRILKMLEVRPSCVAGMRTTPEARCTARRRRSSAIR
jgi:DNA-binding transcriptional ArsR family regulator